VLIAFKPGSNLLERLDPAEEPFYRTALLVEFPIKPDWSPAFRVFPGSLIDRDIALDPSPSVVFSDFPGIVGCICGDDRRTLLHFGNLEYCEGWFIKLGVVDICWGNCAGKGEAVSINQSTQLVPVYLFIAIIAD